MSRPYESGVDVETKERIREFLIYEAELLDDFRLDEWLELVAEDFVLKVPVRTTREANSEQPEFSEENYYFNDGYEMVREQIRRINKEYAWSENPRSRLRHIISNFRMNRTGENTIRVKNNQLVYREKDDSETYDLLPAERHSTLRQEDDGFKLTERTVYLDQKVVRTSNMTIPIF
jgi:3-phenylpropionate/cinnamic acid dioxygenase small subunit